MTVRTPADERTDPAAVNDPAPAPATATQGIAFTVIALVLVVGVPVTFVDWTRNATSPLNVTLCLVLLAVSAWRLTEAMVLQRRQVLRSMFYVFVYVFLAMPALAQSVSGVYPLDGLSYDSSTVTAGLVHLLVGVVAYEVGWASRERLRRGRRNGPGPDDAVRRPGRVGFSPSRAVLAGVVGLGVTLYQVLAYGPAAFFTSRATTTAVLTGSEVATPFYTEDNKTAGLLTIFLSQFLVFAALFAILYARRHRLWPVPSLARETMWRLFIGALVLANVVMNNPLGNGRWWFCLVAVAFVSIYVPFDRPNSQRLYVAGALVLLFFSFASLDLYRVEGRSLNTAGPSQSLVENDTYSMFQMELNGVGYVDAVGHTDGRQLLGSTFVFVPRGLWEDKPRPTGQVVVPRYARAATAWTEAQVDFGLVGVAAFFLLYGAGSRELARWSRGATPGMLHAAIPILAAFQIFLLRGSLQPAVGSLYQLIAAFALVATLRPPLRVTARETPT